MGNAIRRSGSCRSAAAASAAWHRSEDCARPEGRRAKGEGCAPICYLSRNKKSDKRTYRAVKRQSDQTCLKQMRPDGANESARRGRVRGNAQKAHAQGSELVTAHSCKGWHAQLTQLQYSSTCSPL